MAKRVILTGGSSGIGKAVVNQFLTNGYSLTLGIENMSDYLPIYHSFTPTQQSSIELKELNLTNFQSIHQFASEIPPSSILINCAGKVNRNYEKVNGIEKTMLINHFGHFLLTNLLFNNLQMTSINENIECRIINFTSAVEKEAKAFPGNFGKSALRGELPDSVKFRHNESTQEEPFTDLLSGVDWLTEGPQPYFMQTAYSNSSLCILLSTFELAHRLSSSSFSSSAPENEFNSTSTTPVISEITPPLNPTSYDDDPHWNHIKPLPYSRVTVNALCPGYCATPFWNDFTLMKYLNKLLFKSPTKASELLYSLATSSEYLGKSGNFYSTLPNIKPSPLATSKELAKLVWNQSYEIVELHKKQK